MFYIQPTLYSPISYVKKTLFGKPGTRQFAMALREAQIMLFINRNIRPAVELFSFRIEWPNQEHAGSVTLIMEWFPTTLHKMLGSNFWDAGKSFSRFFKVTPN